MVSKAKPNLPAMRFWVRGVISRDGVPPKYVPRPFPIEDDADGRFTVGERTFHNLAYHGKALRILGEARIDDPALCLALIKEGGLEYKAQDAVDLGFIAPDVLEEFGHKTTGKFGVKYVVTDSAVEAKRPLPTFEAMSLEELRKFAGEHGVVLPSPITQAKAVQIIKRDLEKE